MLIYFFQHNKRVNSTSAPALTSGAEFNIVLKESCSIHAPIVTISADTLPDNIWTYNYAYIPAFQRFYYIRDIRSYTSKSWIVFLAVDVLGSYRSQILNSYQYVTRSSVTSDGTLADGRYPATSAVTKHNSAVNVYSGLSIWYVVGVYCDDPITTVAEGINYYVMSSGTYSKLIKHLMSSEVYDIDATELSEGLQKALVNPLQYIASVHAIPATLVSGTDVTTEYYTVHVGGWEMKWPDTSIGPGYDLITAQVLKSVKKTIYNGYIPLNHHPQAANRGEWLDRSDYSSTTITVPPFGTFTVERSRLTLGADGQFRIHVQIDLDMQTGQSLIYIRDGNDDNTIFADAVAQLGVSVPVMQATQDILSKWVSEEKTASLKADAALGVARTAAGSVSNALGAYAKGDAIGTAASAAAGIVDTSAAFISAHYRESAYDAANVATCKKSMAPVISAFGTAGSKLYLLSSAFLNETFTTLAPDDNAHQGKPYCRRVRLSQVSGSGGGGYVECNAINTSGIGITEQEKTAVSEALRAGVYLE